MESEKSQVAKHVDIALAALARGLIDMRTFAEAMIAVGSGDAKAENVWVEAGRIEKRHLDSILLTLADPVGAKLFPRTLLFGGEAKPPEHLNVKATMKSFGAAPPPVAEATQPPPPGSDPVEARYEIARTLGGGGMGHVYDCIDSRLGRRVALKSLRTEILNTKEALLEREATLTARLEHPNIIPVYDAGKDAALGPYYVMRLVDQPSLESLLERLFETPALEQEYTLGRLLRLFVQVCHAVDYAHTQGVIHCDLKPANILLGQFGEVLLVDWGLARKIGEDHSALLYGGTPGYMSPEQLAGGAFDLRTDIYALGSILYEILTLYPAFTIEQLTNPETRNRLVPIPPRERTPKRNIPPELDEICMKALAASPSERFQFVREMAAQLEVFLEGTRDRERREAHATQLAENGDALYQAYREFIDSRPEQAAEVDALRRQIPPYGGEDQKRPLWEAEERLAVVDNLAARTLQAAIGAYEQALDEVRDHSGARRGLAALYAYELDRAVARRNDHDRVYFEGLLKQYDDGTFEASRSQEGFLTLNGATTGTVSIGRTELVGRRLVTDTMRVVEGPRSKIPLQAGSYLVVISGSSWTVRVPVLIKPGLETAVAVELDAVRSAEPGMIYIAGGPALLRDDEGQPLREIQVPAFFIAERPVTFGEYLEFVADECRRDPHRADEILPRSGESGEAYFKWNGKVIAGAIHLLGGLEHEILGWPVVGVDVPSAIAYTAWLAKRTGKRYRLPTEDEWEKAARGVDGRRFPWGDHFDASFCLMRQSRPGVARIEKSGTFPTDISPYGVRDVAGGVADWVRPPPAAITMISRGGAWCDWPSDCRLPVRRVYWANERSSRVGFRVARVTGDAAPALPSLNHDPDDD